MADTTDVVGAEIGGEKFEKQTQAWVCVYLGEKPRRQLLVLGIFTDVVIGF